MTKELTKICPHCAETIKVEAILCKHCKSRLDQLEPDKKEPAHTKTASTDNHDLKKDLSLKQLHLFQMELNDKKKSIGVSYLLLIFLGFVGGHNFYLSNGHEKWGAYHLISFLIFLIINGSINTDITSFLVITISLSVSGIKLFIDLFTLPEKVKAVNKKIEKEIILSL